MDYPWLPFDELSNQPLSVARVGDTLKTCHQRDRDAAPGSTVSSASGTLQSRFNPQTMRSNVVLGRICGPGLLAGGRAGGSVRSARTSSLWLLMPLAGYEGDVVRAFACCAAVMACAPIGSSVCFPLSSPGCCLQSTPSSRWSSYPEDVLAECFSKIWTSHPSKCARSRKHLGELRVGSVRLGSNEKPFKVPPHRASKKCIIMAVLVGQEHILLFRIVMVLLVSLR